MAVVPSGAYIRNLFPFEIHYITKVKVAFAFGVENVHTVLVGYCSQVHCQLMNMPCNTLSVCVPVKLHVICTIHHFWLWC